MEVLLMMETMSSMVVGGRWWSLVAVGGRWLSKESKWSLVVEPMLAGSVARRALLQHHPRGVWVRDAFRFAVVIPSLNSTSDASSIDV
jgi:hypothetical protein